jgi:glutamate 5-kinase
LIAKLVRADALILLTTVDGLLDADGKRVSYIGKVREAMKLVREGQKGKLSKGGMDSKLKAAKNAATAGISVVIANGRQAKVLQGVMSGRDVGSFIPGETI